MTRSRNRNSPPMKPTPVYPLRPVVIRPGYISPIMHPPGIPIQSHMNSPKIINEMHPTKIPSIYRMIYRDYYIQQFKSIYPILMVNHHQHNQLNQQMYITRELIRSGRKEYQYMLNQQEIYYKLQYNTITNLIHNVWKMIDDIDKSCFPNIDFRYDLEFRNINMLFQLLQQIISNKID